MTPALGLYVHWPYCARICPYCDFAVVRDRGRQDEQRRLVDAILQDLAAQSADLADRRLVSIFLGGGTPSLMAPDAVRAVIDAAVDRFAPQDPIEVTMEANPTDAEAERFAAFREAGVTRLSLGVQSFDDAHLQFLKRNHDAASARRAAVLARQTFERLSIDLIFALPGQTPETLEAEIRTALDLGCDHLSAYELTIEPGTAFDRQARRGTLPRMETEAAAGLYETKERVLADAGFIPYEISNHARRADATCRHNLLYWRGEDYIGVGPSAHGRLTAAQGREARVTAQTPAAYLAAVDRTGSGVVERETLTPVAVAEERLMMGLRTLEGVALDLLRPLPLHGLNDLVAEGFVHADGGRLRATTAGRLVLNSIVARLAL